MEEPVSSQSSVRVSLTVEEEVRPRFCLLTGGGVLVGVEKDCSIQELLTGRLEIPAEYVDERIQTIFLDGKAVDDPRIAGLRPGSTIGLSAAMPGIAGAMFRRGSPYAPMRSRISHVEQEGGEPRIRRGDVVVRLFNAVQAEVGLVLLDRGIRIPGRSLAALFRGREKAFGAGIKSAEMDGRILAPGEIFEIQWRGREVCLRVG